MIGKILSIDGDHVTIKLSIDITAQTNLVGVHVVFEEGPTRIVGEIVAISKDTANIALAGEIKENYFVPGSTSKPSFKSNCRIIIMSELALILGEQKISDTSRTYFGKSTIYKNYQINVTIDQFFSNHFAILGNTGSGKSHTTARILQNVFSSSEYLPINSKIIIFDAFGEYIDVFSNITSISPMLNSKVYTTNILDGSNELLKIPTWFLGVDDLALLLGATDHSQLSIIEKTLKLAPIFKGTEETVIQNRNDIIARALLDILRSGNESSQIRDQITAILTSYNTPQLNLDATIYQPGYSRPLKQCIFVDKTGKMMDMELVVSFISTFVVEGLEIPDPDGTIPYNLKDLEKALDFAMISEGVLKSDKVFDYANILSVRLHSLINSSAATYFEYDKYISKEEYLKRFFLTMDGKPAQIIDININYVNDRLAKSIAKILSKMFFDKATESSFRGTEPVHILIEEAHRYVQNDNDNFLLGYNIFDRITKEGRKYGVILGLITQRPSELSETSISQCSNFVILRTLHPKDLAFIREMVPNITEEGTTQLKNLQPGTALVFGSAFPISLNIAFDRPVPEPNSSNSLVGKIWFNQK